MKTYLITGTAGFIGFSLAKKCLDDGHQVIGIDCYSDYYDVNLKYARHQELTKYAHFQEYRLDISDGDKVKDIFAQHCPNIVYHLAAQAGVRYSLQNPKAYTHANIDGFLSILEATRAHTPQHLIFASTSSVYGANSKMPFHENDSTDHPMSLYAATKKANEAMAHSYSHLFNIPVTGTRFFTVYGPWGRPDMALFLFTKNILAGEPINIFNHGQMVRDFTYVSDIVHSLTLLGDKPPTKSTTDDIESASSPIAPYRIVNIGNSQPIALMRYIEAIEESLGMKANYNMMDMQAGDVAATYADCTSLNNLINFKPQTDIKDGVKAFVEWYREYYQC